MIFFWPASENIACVHLMCFITGKIREPENSGQHSSRRKTGSWNQTSVSLSFSVEAGVSLVASAEL